MRRSIRILVLALVILLIGVGSVNARKTQAPADDLAAGGQLYDKWYAVLGVSAPAGNMPIWERQTSNTRSGPDTWRCSECHGWDYKGSEGAYGSGSHATGFPNVLKLAAQMPAEEIVAHLKGSKDPSHDFSKYLDDASLNQLAKFLKEGVTDDSSAIDAVTLKVKAGDLAHGKQLFTGVCAQCHGADGKSIVFRTEGVNEYLGSVANRDPYRFLHRTRFGVAGTEMPVGNDLGWKPADGVDVLAYAQTLPTGLEGELASDAGEGSDPSPKLGGPQGGLVGGLLTGLAVFFGMLGGSVFFLLGLFVLGMLVVWALRKRK
jgi:mono/diheme cytochrome c family protein